MMREKRDLPSWLDLDLVLGRSDIPGTHDWH